MNPETAVTKKNFDELGIDCEIAAGIIAEYVVYFAKLLAEEKNEYSPNFEKIEALETQLLELKREQMVVGAENSALVKKAFYIYAPLLKRMMM